MDHSPGRCRKLSRVYENDAFSLRQRDGSIPIRTIELPSRAMSGFFVEENIPINRLSQSEKVPTAGQPRLVSQNPVDS